jgi:hypothetical protein
VDFLKILGYFNFVISAVMFIVVLFANKVEIHRIRKILDILDNGGWRSCPYYHQAAMKGGRRKYDEACPPASQNPENTTKGGDFYGD